MPKTVLERDNPIKGAEEKKLLVLQLWRFGVVFDPLNSAS